MNALRRLIGALKDWDRTFEQRVVAAAADNSAEIIRLNTDEQLYQGRDAKGQPLRPRYHPITRDIKRAKGQPFDRVTTRDTGAFHRAFKVTAKKKELAVTSTDPKAPDLEAKYGALYGLDPTNLQTFTDDLRPEVVRRFDKHLSDALD